MGLLHNKISMIGGKMGSFNGFILTNDGKKLLEEALTGKRLVFTKFQFGDGETTDDPKEVTELVNVNKETTINQIENSGNGQVMLKVIIDNKDSDTGYYIKEIGVFAKCADGEEVLYAYNKAMKPDYLPVYNGTNLVELEYQNYITIAQIEDVTAIIDENFTYLTKEEANEKFVKQTQLALEERPGIITLNEVYEVGMPARGKLTLTKPITYRELWELPHGSYTVLSDSMAYLGLEGLYSGSLLVFPHVRDDENKRTKLFEFYSHSLGISLNYTGKAFLNLYRGTVETYPDSKITDTVGTWNDKWKKELNQASEQMAFTRNGYLKMPSGLIIQWMDFTCQPISTGTAINFPIAFDNACFQLVMTDGGAAAYTMGAAIRDRFSFFAWAKGLDSRFYQAGVHMLAIGY